MKCRITRVPVKKTYVSSVKVSSAISSSYGKKQKHKNIVCMIWLDLNILASLKDLVMLICRPKLMRTATEQPQRRDTTYKANFKQDEDIHQQNCGDLMIMTDRYHEGSIDLIEIEIFLRVKGHIFEMKMMRSTLAC
ncbi:hypothetical protein RCL_jg5051.t1 [Rhizophagus clarus]|uniref:Uncharacterized protein n=1 Tax=Rhizophagus clarus TaxID=94130 RepID=A0A8H3LAZ0_9GLOM|nr:hypothetical protein RCL_jg5051.t1 [Rhizophagus clarus]